MRTLPPGLNTPRTLWGHVCRAHYHVALHDPEQAEWAARARGSSYHDRLEDLKPALDVLGDPRWCEGDAGLLHLRNHANAALTVAHHLRHHGHGSTKELHNHVTAHAPAALAKIQASSIGGSTSLVSDLLAQAYGALVGLKGLKLTVLKKQSGAFDPSGITSFNAEISHRSKYSPETFDALAQKSDPRSWCTYFPGMFEASTNIGPNGTIENRFADHPQCDYKDQQPLGTN